MGFSQGAALAASLILQHSDQAQPLVDCAVFICGSLPWMLRSEVASWPEKLSVTCQITEVSDLESEAKGLIMVKEASISIERVQNKPLNGYQDGMHAQDSQACFLHPAKYPLHFPIPTAHIYGGRKDRYFELSKALVNLGSETHGVKVFDHDAGHVIPRGEWTTSRMAEIVSWVAEKVIWRC
jgi:pimeloyl-ACP methyl ester carboxylesterase